MNVLTFGVITEIIGKPSFTMGDISSTAALKEKLEAEFPRLKGIDYAIAVNKQLTTNDVVLESTSTVGLLPPFSGG